MKIFCLESSLLYLILQWSVKSQRVGPWSMTLVDLRLASDDFR